MRVLVAGEVRTHVIAIRKKDACATLQQIGDHVGVTRERIRQILVEANLRTSSIRRNQTKVCLNCGEIYKAYRGKYFCSLKCYYNYCKIPIVCDGCGNLFYRRKCDLIHYTPRRIKVGFKITNASYCSSECFGRQIGKLYGFGAHPENIRRRK